MKKHNAELEHINRSGQSVEWVVQIVETAVAAALEKLHMTTMEPLKVIYADSDGLTSLWRESQSIRATLVLPTTLFRSFMTIFPCEHTLVIRADSIDTDRIPVFAHAVMCPIFNHLLHTHFSCAEVEGMSEAFDQAWPIILEAADALHDPVAFGSDPLARLFADWVMGPWPYMTDPENPSFKGSSRGPDPDSYEAALTCKKLMAVADQVFSGLVQERDDSDGSSAAA